MTKSGKRRGGAIVTIPLIKVLADQKPASRKILLDHLDDDALHRVVNAVDRTFDKVSQVTSRSRPRGSDLRGGFKHDYYKRVKLELQPHRKAVTQLVGNRKRTLKNRRRSLIAYGGNPLAILLEFALPLLVKKIIGA